MRTLIVALGITITLSGCFAYNHQRSDQLEPVAAADGPATFRHNLNWMSPSVKNDPPSNAAQTSISITQKLPDTAAKRLALPTSKAPSATPTKLADEDFTNRYAAAEVKASPVRCVTTDTWSLPVRETQLRVTAQYGYFTDKSTYFKTLRGVGGLKDSSAQGVFHPGVDYQTGLNAPVYAVSDAVVEAVGHDDQYGLHITLRLLSASGGHGTQVIYGHLSDSFTVAGQSVHCGQILGISGATGKAVVGAHLHFEVRVDGQPVDPMPYIAQAKEAKLPSWLTEGLSPSSRN